MQTQSRFFDDIAQLLTSAMGAAQGVRQEAELAVRHRLERLMAEYEFVSREEFEAVRDMAVKAREENEALAARLDALESALKVLAAKTEAAASRPGQRGGTAVRARSANRRAKARGTPRRKRY